MSDTQQRMREIMAANKAKRLPPQGGLTVTPPIPAQVRHRCGHAVGLAHYEGQDCVECRAKQRQAKAAQRRAKPKNLLDEQGRLPDGSEISAVYCGETQTWKVILEVPNDERKYFAIGTSLEMTCRKAADLYRATVKGAL